MVTRQLLRHCSGHRLLGLLIMTAVLGAQAAASVDNNQKKLEVFDRGDSSRSAVIRVKQLKENKEVEKSTGAKKHIVKRVRSRGERKQRNYFPVQDGTSSRQNSVSTTAVDSKWTPITTTTATTASLSTSTHSTTPGPNNTLLETLPVTKPSYVNIIRNAKASTVATNVSNVSLFNVNEEQFAISDREEFSRKLPTSDNDDDADSQPSVSLSRTSSRLLFPPSIKRPPPSPTPTPASTRSYTTTSNPVSYFNAATPEFNHVSYLTHPTKVETLQLTTPSPGLMGTPFGYTKQTDDDIWDDRRRFQTKFYEENPSNSVNMIPQPPTRSKPIKNHSFFHMGRAHSPATASTTTARPVTTTKTATARPQHQAEISKQFLGSHDDDIRVRGPFHEDRQFVSVIEVEV